MRGIFLQDLEQVMVSSKELSQLKFGLSLFAQMAPPLLAAVFCRFRRPAYGFLKRSGIIVIFFEMLRSLTKPFGAAIRRRFLLVLVQLLEDKAQIEVSLAIPGILF